LLPQAPTWIPPRRLDGRDRSWPRQRLAALSYAIGVLLKGDGSVCVTRKTDYSTGKLKLYRAYKIDLKNKSIGFINAFNVACSTVLRRKSVRVAGSEPRRALQIQYCSKAFVSWWMRQKIRGFRRIIAAFPVEYLRSRFDSDCNVHESSVDLCGAVSHRRPMEFERRLCIKLGIRAGKIRPYGKTGDINYVGSKKIVNREQRIRFRVNARDFLRCIGGLSVEWRDYELKHARKGRDWTPWKSNVRERALMLKRENSWSCKKITDELKKELGHRIPYSTANAWLNSEAGLT